MHPETLQLEELRQQIEDLEQQIKEHTDYIDHGQPNPRQSRRVVKMQEQSEQVRAKLRSAIGAIRKEKPAAFDEWINIHQQILGRILAEQTTDREAANRRNMARLTLSQWEKVVAGEREYVFISSFFLNDYYAEVRSLLPQHIDPSKSTQKSWWQFWK